jgi:hypothetical protein
MKRSEMIKLIGGFLPYVGTQLDKRGNRADIKLVAAEKILDTIETAGMLPPERTYEDWTGMGTITETDNTWTPE